jgi:hypothetical protein
MGSAKLQDVVKNQHDQMVELTSQVQEAEKSGLTWKEQLIR